MAAAYLHNALYSRNPSDHRDMLEHARNLSTVSSATVLSQPTDPLLQPAAPGEAYFDQITRQSRNPDVTPARLQWGDPLPPETDPTVVGEKGKGRRKNGEPGKRVKRILEVVMAIWAIYNTISYFLAFSIYTRDGSSTGQAVSLTLGTSSGLSFAFSLCSLVLSFVKHKLHLRGLPFKYMAHICSSLHYLSSICLLGPAVTNLVFLFLWRNSPNPRYNLHHRCHADIDVIWSPSPDPCNKESPSTAIWITLSSVRLAATFIILVGYLVISLLHPDYPLHQRRSSEPYPPMPRGDRLSLFPTILAPDHDLRAQHHGSDSTLNATLRGDDASRPRSRLRLARSRSSGLSADTFTLPGESTSAGRSVLPESDSERDLNGRMDRFRSLLMEISQETETAVEFAQADHASSPDSPSPHGLPPAYSYDENGSGDGGDDDDPPQGGSPDNVFNLRPVPRALGYNEFGLPYPPDQDIAILNGVIRRMPTIESMGSGEIGTSIGSHQVGGSIYASSRPPTRNTLISFTSNELELMTASQPPSRANSLSVRAELLVGMSNIGSSTSEHGELQSRSDVAMRRMSSPTNFLDAPFIIGGHGDTHSTRTSRSTSLSYHTATMGSFGDSHSSGPSNSIPREREPSS